MKYLKKFNENNYDICLFTEDELIDIETMFLEYVDKYNIGELKENDEVLYFDKDGQKLQYTIGRYRNVVIEIFFYESDDEIASELYLDIKSKFLPRIEKFGYRIIHFSKHGNEDWNSNRDDYDDEVKKTITITITK